MSIRLRFTLVYNAILAVTLAIFGFALYSIQAQSTLESIKDDITQTSNTLGENVLKSSVSSSTDASTTSTATADATQAASNPGTNPAGANPAGSNPPGANPPGSNPPPLAFQTSSDQGLQQVPEREIVRILDSDGNLVASPFGRKEDLLPLSDEGLLALQSGQTWWETVTYQDQKMLVYSRPAVSSENVTYFVQVARPLAERENSLEILASTLLMASIITILVAFVIGWLFSGFIMKPIKHITNTAHSIGDESDFSKRVDYKGPQDEVGQLAMTFNSMLTKLQDSYQRVAHALEMQRNFVADVSHELRTPLTTLRGNLELLRRKPPIPTEERTDIQNDMVDESDRLIRLVNDLLTLARADAGRHLNLESVQVYPTIEECVRQSLIIYSGRDIIINAPKKLALLGDRDALKQVILILLDNALKYSESKIIVTAIKDESVVELRVRDFGKGLSPEKLEHVFDRFYRDAANNTVSGFGLGLSIAKSLVEGQNGDITMHSEEGEGAEVVMHFTSAGY